MSDERALLLADLRERAAYFATLTDLGLPGSTAPAPVARALETPAPAPPAAAKAPPAETLEQIRADLGDCQRCVLAKTRTKIVFGQGSPQARLMFVGEAPGGDEDEQGLAFVGKAGQLLTKIIEAINLKRDDVFIANVLKCRPPGNRNPEPDEVAKCTPFLLRQIELIGPKLIVAMGRFAAQTLLNTDASIASLRGRVHQYAGRPLIVTYHPAYLLRNLPDKSKAWADLVFARRTMASL
jgi:uracil-DNA glycosylase